MRPAAACLVAASAGAAALAGQLEAARSAQAWAGGERVVEARVEALERTPWGWWATLSAVVAVDRGSEPLPGRIRLAGDPTPAGLPRFEDALPGDRVRARLRLRAQAGLRNPGGRDADAAARRAGQGLGARLVHPALHVRLASGRLERLHALRARLARELSGAGAGGPLLAALAVGARGALRAETREAFAALGVSHLLAVSGLHLALVAALVFAGLRRALVRWSALARARDTRLAALAGACGAGLGYALLAGWGVPVRRALVLLLALGAAWLRGRPTARLAPLWLAALWILAAEPDALFVAGAQLSFAASAGLLLAAPVARRGALGATLATSAAALAVTAPLAALHFGARAPLALLANLLLVPWTALLLLPAALVAALALACGLPGSAALLGGAELAARATLRASEAAAAALPAAWAGAAPPGIWCLAAGALGLLALRTRSLALRSGVAAALSALLALAPAAPLGPAPPRALFLDVGQGDAALVQGRRAALLVDAGVALPGGGLDLGRVAVLPALRALGVARLDLVVASHADLDHRGGLVAVLAALPVGAVWLPRGASRDPGFAALRRAAAARGVPLHERGAGDPALVLGDLRVTPLWPRGPASEAERNDTSLVVRVDVAGRRLLFPGDLEAAGEAGLLASGADLASDVLKLPHHGSRSSSSPRLLAAVAPGVAVASAPCRGRFAMPHPAVAERLRDAGAALWWTGRDGAVWLALGGPLSAWSHAAARRCPLRDR